MILDPSSLRPEEISAHNQYAGIYNYIPTSTLQYLMNSPCKTTALFSGNQFGKGECMVMDWIHRIMCIHPNKYKNIQPADRFRTLRVCTQTLPGEKDGEDTNNTIYPVFKRRLPGCITEDGKYNGWIVKDIVSRNFSMQVRPNTTRFRGAKPVTIEFSAYSQDVQRQAGVQRRAIMQDEESTEEFFQEQQARTLATGGDVMIGFTPVPGQIGWMYDNIYERARIIVRSKAVRDRWKARFNEDLPEIQVINGKDDIMVIMAATDDNPTYNKLAKELGEREGRSLTGKQYLDEFFESRYGPDNFDNDVWDARRYGIFKQFSGKVFRIFTERVHKIDGYHYFPTGLPIEWKHFRGIDYHQKNPWAYVHIMLSPANEIFVVRDGSFDPTRMKTYEIAQEIADLSEYYKFSLNLIDPLANETQVNTSTTTREDLNRHFRGLRAEERGTGGYWDSWDTKGFFGYEQFMMRLMNSIRVGAPFCNSVTDNNRTITLPTIWFFDRCRTTIESMKNWRFEEWETTASRQKNDEKEKRQQKWSHHPIAVECLLKSPMVSKPIWKNEDNHTFSKHEYRRMKGGMNGR